MLTNSPIVIFRQRTGTSFFLSFALLTLACGSNGGSSSNRIDAGADVTGSAGSSTQWAKSLTSGTSATHLNSVAVDGNGNIFAAGKLDGTGSVSFGNGVSLTGISSGQNGFLIKYNTSGEPQWVRGITTGGNTNFQAVAVDTSGNIYIAGNQSGNSSVSYGSGITATGTYSGANALVVKYNTSGTPLWAKTVSAGTDGSSFSGIAVNSSSELYAVGTQQGVGVSYTYGPGVSAASGATPTINGVIVKYDSSGNALWAKTTTAGAVTSLFTSVATDTAGSAFIVGYLNGTGTANFGNSVTLTGLIGGDATGILLKCDSAGVPQWGAAPSTAPNISEFKSVATDSSGNILVAGRINGSNNFDFGSGVSISGAHASQSNALIVKYSSTGNAQWARSTTAAAGSSNFLSILVDSSGSIWTAGSKNSGAYSFSSGISVSYAQYSALLVKYDSSGNALLAKTTVTGSNPSQYYSIAANGSGNIHAVGYQTGNGAFSYGSGLDVTGSSTGNNVLIVKYP
jgi:Beta-propeller repeat